MKLKRFPVLTFSVFFLIVFSLSFFPKRALSAFDNVVINEVQIAGVTSDDEFVELFNPTNSAIDLTDWRLTRATAAGNESNLVSSLSGTIPAGGYYLITSLLQAQATQVQQVSTKNILQLLIASQTTTP